MDDTFNQASDDEQQDVMDQDDAAFDDDGDELTDDELGEVDGGAHAVGGGSGNSTLPVVKPS